MTENNYVKIGDLYIYNGFATISDKVITALTKEGFIIAHDGLGDDYNSVLHILINQNNFDWGEGE